MFPQDPERKLSLAYAPTDCRDALSCLWMLDERLGAIVAATRDPMLGEIRLTWWRDALEAFRDQPPPDEPLLAALSSFVRAGRFDAAQLAQLTQGWVALLASMPFDEDSLRDHGERRGALLFRLAAGMLGGAHAGVSGAGAGWALTDLAYRTSNAVTAARALELARGHFAAIPSGRWPRALRPLVVLATLARFDSREGAPSVRHQGAPGRVLRAMKAGLLG